MHSVYIYNFSEGIYVYIYVYGCVCVCVCVLWHLCSLEKLLHEEELTLPYNLYTLLLCAMELGHLFL